MAILYIILNDKKIKFKELFKWKSGHLSNGRLFLATNVFIHLFIILEALSLIGYSMGTTIQFILLSLRPDYEQYFRPFIALAPVAFLGLTKSIIFPALAPLGEVPVIRSSLKRV